MSLNNEQKAAILDKMVIHAETIEKNEWVEGLFVDAKFASKIKEHALYFLTIYRKEANIHNPDKR